MITLVTLLVWKDFKYVMKGRKGCGLITYQIYLSHMIYSRLKNTYSTSTYYINLFRILFLETAIN